MPATQICRALQVLKLAIGRKAIIGPDDRVLHFAPEKCCADMVRPIAASYVGADLGDGFRDAGFAAQEYTTVEPDVFRYGLIHGEKIFIGIKG